MNYGVEAVQRGAVQKATELDALAPLLQELKPATIMEIGVDYGGTSWFLSHYCQRLICIDKRYPKPVPHVSSCAVRLVKGDSTSERVFQSVKHEVVDVLFIDGDHSFNGVAADFISYRSLLSYNGMVVLHDIAATEDSGIGVPRFWHTLKEKFDTTEILHEPMEWGGLGVIHNAGMD